jgi:UDP-glucose 4-epimerase
MSGKVLITGGLGFVGSRIATNLAQEGFSVILGSRKLTCSPYWLPQAELTQIKWEDINSLEMSCKDVDVIIHAAGMNAQECFEDPVSALKFNGLATARLVAAAMRAGVRRIIYFSTAHVYANELFGTINEKTCPLNLHPYATSHLAGENAVLSASINGNIKGIVLRLSNGFGTPMHNNINCWKLLVNGLCREAVQNSTLTLHSSGQQLRDFIGINEVSRVTRKLAFDVEELSFTGIFNVGTGVAQSVLAMAKIIQDRCLKVLGFMPELQYKRYPKKELNASLNYCSDRLMKAGIKLDDSNNIDEIDNLLSYCNKTFNSNKNLFHG